MPQGKRCLTCFVLKLWEMKECGDFTVSPDSEVVIRTLLLMSVLAVNVPQHALEQEYSQKTV